MWEDLQYFVYVVECGSFNEAAVVLSTTITTISRRISALENKIGVSLFNKNDKRGAMLTHIGQDIYNLTHQTIHNLEQHIEDFRFKENQIIGHVTAILPPSLSVLFILKKLPEFSKEYPKISLHLFHSATDIGQLGRSYDFALSAMYPSSKTLVVEPLLEDCGILCASKSFIDKYGIPQRLTDLNDNPFPFCQFLLANGKPTVEWSVKSVHTGEYFRFSLSNYLIATDSLLEILSFIKNDLCIGILSKLMAMPQIKSGELVHVLPEYEINNGFYYAIRPKTYKSRAVTVFEAFVKKCFLTKI